MPQQPLWALLNNDDFPQQLTETADGHHEYSLFFPVEPLPKFVVIYAPPPTGDDAGDENVLGDDGAVAGKAPSQLRLTLRLGNSSNDAATCPAARHCESRPLANGAALWPLEWSEEEREYAAKHWDRMAKLVVTRDNVDSVPPVDKPAPTIEARRPAPPTSSVLASPERPKRRASSTVQSYNVRKQFKHILAGDAPPTEVMKSAADALHESPSEDDQKDATTCIDHRQCMVMPGDAMMVFGGCTDRGRLRNPELRVYSLASKQWSTIDDDDANVPDPRHGHVMLYDRESQTLLIHGGYAGDFDPIHGHQSQQQRCFSEWWMFDSKDRQWTTHEAHAITGPPPALAHHSAVLHISNGAVLARECILFGGVRSQKRSATNDVYVFDLLNRNWHRPTMSSDTRPTARYMHSACLLGDYQQMVVFGGLDPARLEYFNDVWVLDLAMMEWERKQCTGDGPSPRARFAATLLPPGNRWLVHGGFDGERKLNDCYVLDMSKWRWTKVVVPLSSVARDGHQVSVIPGGGASTTTASSVKLCMYGGMNGDQVEIVSLPVWWPIDH